MSRRDFDLAHIKAELQKLHFKLERRLAVYVAGGFVMVALGLKAGTKDIDVVLENKPQFESLVSGLQSIGYKVVSKPLLTKTYRKLAAEAILENNDGFRWDVFLNVVANKLFLSDSMKGRAQLYLNAGNLRVCALSKEDIFLMKGVTDRDRDLEDMYRIARSGIEYKLVFDECLFQSEKTHRIWEAGLYEKCKELKEKYNLTVPFSSKLRKMGEKKLIFTIYMREISKGNNTEKSLVRALDGKLTRRQVISDLRFLTKAGKLEVEVGRFVVPKTNR